MDVKMVHPSQPKNVVVTTEAAFRVYKKTGWIKAPKDAEVSPENPSPAEEAESKKK